MSPRVEAAPKASAAETAHRLGAGEPGAVRIADEQPAAAATEKPTSEMLVTASEIDAWLPGVGEAKSPHRRRRVVEANLVLAGVERASASTARCPRTTPSAGPNSAIGAPSGGRCSRPTRAILVVDGGHSHRASEQPPARRAGDGRACGGGPEADELAAGGEHPRRRPVRAPLSEGALARVNVFLDTSHSVQSRRARRGGEALAVGCARVDGVGGEAGGGHVVGGG